MGEPLTISVRHEPGYVLLTAAGEINIFTVARLREMLLTLADSGQPVIADLDRTLRLARTRADALQALPAVPEPGPLPPQPVPALTGGDDDDDD